MASFGFDWVQTKDVFTKIKEELLELEQELPQEPSSELNPRASEALKEEWGDLVFTLAQMARKLKLDPEQMLEKANQKFLGRFALMESFIEKDSLNFDSLSINEFAKYWELAKDFEKKQKGVH